MGQGLHAETQARGDEDLFAKRLRAPGELLALVYCIAANVLVLAVSVTIVLAGTEWLSSHPFVAKHVDAFRGVLLGALVAVPATIIGRQAALPDARGEGARVGRQQMPELYDAFLRVCQKLGLDEVPELYVSHQAPWPVGYRAALGHAPVVILNARLVEPRWREDLDWLSFILAQAVGALRLGHARWWIEVLTVYTRVVPWLRTPLVVKWAFSRDRCAAFAVPNVARGLLVEAVGRVALPSFELAPFIEQTKEPTSFWEVIDAMRHQRPSIMERARALREAGLFPDVTTR